MTVKKQVKKSLPKKEITIKKTVSKKKTRDITNILLVGVGGQGIIVASEILSKAIMLAGYDIKKSEIHGMSQRGGSVNSHIRYGKNVYSPTIRYKTANIILSLEKLEAMREIDYLCDDGVLIVNEEKIMPTSVEIGMAKYPPNIDSMLRSRVSHIRMIDAQEIAKEINSPKTFNTILLGVLSMYIKEISEKNWYDAIKDTIKKDLYEKNVRAFKMGRQL